MECQSILLGFFENFYFFPFPPLIPLFGKFYKPALRFSGRGRLFLYPRRCFLRPVFAFSSTRFRPFFSRSAFLSLLYNIGTALYGRAATALRRASLSIRHVRPPSQRRQGKAVISGHVPLLFRFTVKNKGTAAKDADAPSDLPFNAGMGGEKSLYGTKKETDGKPFASFPFSGRLLGFVQRLQQFVEFETVHGGGLFDRLVVRHDAMDAAHPEVPENVHRRGIDFGYFCYDRIFRDHLFAHIDILLFVMSCFELSHYSTSAAKRQVFARTFSEKCPLPVRGHISPAKNIF